MSTRTTSAGWSKNADRFPALLLTRHGSPADRQQGRDRRISPHMDRGAVTGNVLEGFKKMLACVGISCQIAEHVNNPLQSLQTGIYNRHHTVSFLAYSLKPHPVRILCDEAPSTSVSAIMCLTLSCCRAQLQNA